jgi:hypothetical protein
VTSRSFVEVSDSPELCRYPLDAVAVRLQMVGDVATTGNFETYLPPGTMSGGRWQRERLLLRSSRRWKHVETVRVRERGKTLRNVVITSSPLSVPIDPPETVSEPVSMAMQQLKAMTGFSYRDLAELVGASHTTLRAIAEAGRAPRPDLEERVRELGSLVRRLQGLTNGINHLRAALTQSVGGRPSAADFLGQGNYDAAFQAAQRVLYPEARELPAAPPLEFYDEPSSPVHEDDG